MRLPHAASRFVHPIEFSYLLKTLWPERGTDLARKQQSLHYLTGLVALQCAQATIDCFVNCHTFSNYPQQDYDACPNSQRNYLITACNLPDL